MTSTGNTTGTLDRYHFTNDEPVTVRMKAGETVQIGSGWLAITEHEYRQLTEEGSRTSSDTREGASSLRPEPNSPSPTTGDLDLSGLRGLAGSLGAFATLVEEWNRWELNNPTPPKLDYKRLAQVLQAGSEAIIDAAERGERAEALLIGDGWVYFEGDVGEEYSPNHPTESGEMPGATDIRRATFQEDHLHTAFQSESLRANFAEARATRAERKLAEARGSAVGEIAAERRRQVEAEGWTTEHDDQYKNGELAAAAAAYAAATTWNDKDRRFLISPLWPWSPSWWKPKDRRRDLIRAGALIVAAIEQMDRAALSPDHGGSDA